MARKRNTKNDLVLDLKTSTQYLFEESIWRTDWKDERIFRISSLTRVCQTISQTIWMAFVALEIAHNLQMNVCSNASDLYYCSNTVVIVLVYCSNSGTEVEVYIL